MNENWWFKDTNEERPLFSKKNKSSIVGLDEQTDGRTSEDKKGPLTFLKLKYDKKSDV